MYSHEIWPLYCKQHVLLCVEHCKV